MSSYRSMLIDSDSDCSLRVRRRRLEERASEAGAGASSVGDCGAVRPGTSTRRGRRRPRCRAATASDGRPMNRCAVSASAVAQAERSRASRSSASPSVCPPSSVCPRPRSAAASGSRERHRPVHSRVRGARRIRPAARTSAAGATAHCDLGEFEAPGYVHPGSVVRVVQAGPSSTTASMVSTSSTFLSSR